MQVAEWDCAGDLVEDMPTNRPTVAELAARVNDLEAAVASLHPRTPFWRKLRKLSVWLPMLGLIVAVASLVVAYFAWLQPQWKEEARMELKQQIDNEIELKFKEHNFDALVADVNSMKGHMAEISGFLKILAEAQLKRVSSLAPQQFRGVLPEVKSVLEVARISDVQDNPSVEDIKTRLSQSPRTPDYWGAATALINFRSGPEKKPLPTCLSTGDPKMTLLKDLAPTDTEMSVSNAVYENCEITLDAPDVQQLYMRVFMMKDLELRNCLVHYQGGPLLVPAKPLPGKGPPTILFVNCTFAFAVSGTPADNGKRFLNGLITARDPARISYTFG